MSKKPGFRAAINAMCKSCIYDPGAGGTWRAQVEGCTSPSCPLFPLRPTTTTKEKEDPHEWSDRNERHEVRTRE